MNPIASQLVDLLQGENARVHASDDSVWWGDRKRQQNKNTDPENHFKVGNLDGCIGCAGPKNGSNMREFKPPKFD